MAQYKTPSGADPIDFLLRENENLKNRVQALEGRRLSTWDRYDHTGIAAPVEGQHVVNKDDEKVYWYSNGSWRTFTAAVDLQRAYMQQSAGQTIATASTTNLTNYASAASVDDTDITTDETNGRFQIAISGIYLAQVVVLWDSAFTGGKMARIQTAGGNTIQDTNSWTQWVSEQDAGTNTDQVTAEAVFFLNSVSSPTVQAAVRQLSGSNKNVLTVDFSIVRLGDY